MPPQRSPSSSRVVWPQLCCYGKLCSPMDLHDPDWQPGASDVFRRRTWESAPRGADLRRVAGPTRTVQKRFQNHWRDAPKADVGGGGGDGRQRRSLLRRDGKEKRGTRPAHGGHLSLSSSLPGHPVDQSQGNSSCRKIGSEQGSDPASVQSAAEPALAPTADASRALVASWT